MSSSIDTTVFTEILLEHTEIAFEELANFGILCGENIIDIEDFESDMGIWNDGGSDCFRIWNDTLFGEGEFSMRLRDNSNSSRMFTESLDLTEFEAVTVTLDFITDGFDGNTEEIFMEVSFDGGATFVMVDQLANDVDFNNNEMYRATFLVEGEPFTDNTVLQIRCNASSNADKLYLDNILITGCIETQEGLTEEMTQSRSSEENNFTKENTTLEYSIYPNPSRGAFTIDLADINSGEVEIQVFNTVGAIVRTEIITPEQSRTTIDLQNLNEGLYILKIENNNNIYTERLIISK